MYLLWQTGEEACILGKSLLMKISLPGEVKFIIESLEREGHEAYAVGGCIRDALLGREPKDWDITTDALPEEIKSIFPVTIDTGIAHGTVTVRKNKKSFEVTTYRTDGKYLDGRHPESVTFVRDLKEDLRRRDFTVNALAYNEKNGLVDEFDGISDLNNKIICCVDDADRRFSEDALRMMRAVRFVAQLGFDIEAETKDSIKRLAPTLDKISAERICDELLKLICTDRPETMTLLYELGLSKVFFPEWDEMMETPQNTRHHSYMVGEHTIHVMNEVRPEKVMRLAALFHDIGKPVCRRTDAKGADHFVGHPHIGAKMAKTVMKRLKLDNDTIGYVQRLVKFHDDRPSLSKRNVRRCINRMGEDLFPDIFELRRADIMGQSEYKRQEKLAEIELFKKYYDEIMADNECVSLKDLCINGQDIMEIGVPAGPGIGSLLKEALEMVIADPQNNNRKTLLGYVKKLYEDS